MLAVCGIVHQQGRFLVCKRPSGGVFPGFWELPTEALEGEETFEDALDRVFFERLGVRVESACPMGAVDEFLGENVRFLGYNVELQKNFVQIYGYEDFRWVRPRDLKKLRFLNSSVMLLKQTINV